MTTTIAITGMHCASCKALIEEVCAEMPGVRSCTVDLAGGTGVIEHDDRADIDKLMAEVRALGPYEVRKV